MHVCAHTCIVGYAVLCVYVCTFGMTPRINIEFALRGDCIILIYIYFDPAGSCGVGEITLFGSLAVTNSKSPPAQPHSCLTLRPSSSSRSSPSSSIGCSREEIPAGSKQLFPNGDSRAESSPLAFSSKRSSTQPTEPVSKSGTG